MDNQNTFSFELTILVPLYNSADTIDQLLSQLSNLKVEGGYEIVLINDGSRDATLEKCRHFMKTASVPIRLLDLGRNFGEHNAVMTGLRHARGRYIVNLDDDLQNPPDEALRLMEHAKAGGYDVVYSWFEKKQHSWWRNLGSRFANWLTCIVLDKPKDLYLSSFRCMSAFLAETVTRYEGPYPYIDGLILQSTNRIGSIKTRHDARANGESGYTLRKLFRLLGSIFVNFSVMPLRVATVLGMVLSGLGLLSVAFVVLEWLFWKTPAGWSSLMAVMLVFSGAQLLILGVVGEYLGRLFLTVNNRPQAIVRTNETSGD